MIAAEVRQAKPGDNIMPITSETATALLKTMLASGPVASVTVRRATDAAGIGWRTVERAAKTIGVQTIKVGRSWVWKLPGEDRAPMPPTDAADSELAGLKAAVIDLVARVARLEAAAGAQGQREGAARADGPRPAGRPRRTTFGPPQSPVWKGRETVRCADCAHADLLDDDGHCHVSGLTVRNAFARRACPSWADLLAIDEAMLAGFDDDSMRAMSDLLDGGVME